MASRFKTAGRCRHKPRRTRRSHEKTLHFILKTNEIEALNGQQGSSGPQIIRFLFRLGKNYINPYLDYTKAPIAGTAIERSAIINPAGRFSDPEKAQKSVIENKLEGKCYLYVICSVDCKKKPHVETEGANDCLPYEKR